MRQHRTLDFNKRPKIKGKGHFTFRVKYCPSSAEYKAIGYLGKKKKFCIGEIAAFTCSSSDYLTILCADLKLAHTGKGYGLILYWALARKAKRMGLKGLRSRCWGRNNYSEGAWQKIQTHTKGDYSYIKFE